MTREKPPARRPSVTRSAHYITGSNRDIKLLVTLGFNEAGRVREIFCADFKAGSDNHAIVMDSCILLSRLFQHGDSPREIVDTLSQASLIKTLATVAAEEDEHSGG